jgi:GT2 family glycosyltransferase
MPAAYNAAIRCAKSDNLIFTHQDVKFTDKWFDKLVNIIESCPDWGIIGCAGIGRKFSIRNIGKWGGYKHSQVAVGVVYGSDNEIKPSWDGIKDTMKVHCVDECLFVLNKKTKLIFDEDLNGFHFYGTDICLQARAKKYGVYAANLPIIHYGKYSTSMSDASYWKLFHMLHKKWSHKFKTLLGTHMHWNNNELISYINYKLSGPDFVEIKIQGIGVQFED